MARARKKKQAPRPRAHGATHLFPDFNRKRPKLKYANKALLADVLKLARTTPPKPSIPLWRWAIGIDPTERIKELTLTELAELHRDRAKVAGSRGNHDLFEVLVHFAFPDPNEMAYAYLVIWKLRDRWSNTRIAKKLGVSVAVAKRHGHHAVTVFWRFTKKLCISQKLLNKEKCLTEEELIKEVARASAG